MTLLSSTQAISLTKVAIYAALTAVLVAILPAEGQPSKGEPGTHQREQDWYQIELVLFAQNIAPKRDELWPLRRHLYPRDTLGLDPIAGEITPPSLRLLPFVTVDGSDVQVENDRPVFRFEDKSRYRRQAGPGSIESRQQQAQQLAYLFRQTQSERRAFARLSKEALNLGPIANRVRRASRYRLLDHWGWQQPIVPGKNPAVLTQAGEYYGEQRELDGTIHITRSRYLHLHTDLWLSVFSSDDNIIDPNSRALIDKYADRYPKLTGGLERSGYFPAAEYVLQQSRRMRSGETHYIDHPYFGLIALITPLTTEEEDSLVQAQSLTR